MKSLFSPAILTAAVLAMATLAGCASGPASQQSQPRGSMGSMGAVGQTKSMGSMNMSNSDMMAMCRDMDTQMMSAKTPHERQAMMAEHMKNMPPEMMQHCQMMRSQQGVQPSR